MRARTATAALGLLSSLAISVLAWIVFDVPFLFLFVPFVPFLFGGPRAEPPDRPVERCPQCGFATRNPAFDFCPRDGTRLTRPE